jgi:hypothetical protein
VGNSIPSPGGALKLGSSHDQLRLERPKTCSKFGFGFGFGFGYVSVSVSVSVGKG